jgi:hypothetical protein
MTKVTCIAINQRMSYLLEDWSQTYTLAMFEVASWDAVQTWFIDIRFSTVITNNEMMRVKKDNRMAKERSLCNNVGVVCDKT